EVSLFVFSMIMLVLSANFIQLFMFWEAVGLCSYLLIGFWYDKPAAAAAGKAAPAPAPEPEPEPKGPPITAKEVDGKVVLVFPAERFDLDVAAALGKRDWDQVVRKSDNLPGATRDKIQRDGAGWIAPIEFLSEVFIDGKPLTKAEFERDARAGSGVRSLDVHFPRFGAVTLLEIAGKGRFVTSLGDPERAAGLLA
ncbi:MAG TPA: proton-conducting transporter membrane subunit, partial [Kofleriaceae bacterium]|nr:proton-conducting transporter membrane subunit [Kofleriaceae bacterium]